ncbi:proteinase inhibitor I4 serpin [Nocardiopsis sp. TSRI0078]|uniref:SSI family serine proteinase inhibitor n=1 Tax=unclassified Nocardiopsis TaxID=2649073 RepID=UPI00093E1338|nr:SSI family serine proteinase inhibitor [Nocardiopsis sp. TSRI0078]OKI20759.1 proteinase inhibitor I4 serpin [Nocardiopsis sp. TSRI0078]
MAQYTFATALPTRLAALAALGLLITACGNEPAEVNAPAPRTDETTNPSDPAEDPSGDAEVRLTIERSLSDDEALTPEEGYEEGVWTLTCGPVGGDHPAPEEACERIEEVGAEPFVLDTSDMMCTMQVGGPEVAHVTGHIDGTDIDTRFDKHNGCEIERFETVEAVLNP